METLTVQLPFAGFYCSKWDGMLDFAQERETEYLEEQEQERPEFERVTADEINDAFMYDAAFGDAYRAIAADYAPLFCELLGDELGIKLTGKFDGMDSPKFYNFETDRVFAQLPESVFRLFLIWCRQDDFKTLTEVIRERHTSRDGFISWYSNRPDEWLSRPVSDWDHNELETLLLAAIRLKGVDLNELEWSVYESLSENDYQYFDNCVDWESLETRLEDLRQDKRDDYLADMDLDELPEPPYRCPLTMDLFATETRHT